MEVGLFAYHKHTRRSRTVIELALSECLGRVIDAAVVKESLGVVLGVAADGN